MMSHGTTETPAWQARVQLRSDFTAPDLQALLRAIGDAADRQGASAGGVMRQLVDVCDRNGHTAPAVRRSSPDGA